MSYRGHVEKGVVVLDVPTDFPEGTPVKVDPLLPEDMADLHPEIKKFSGILPPDIDAREEYARYLLEKYK